MTFKEKKIELQKYLLMLIFKNTNVTIYKITLYYMVTLKNFKSLFKRSQAIDSHYNLYFN